jgi:hypothetical protein
VIRRLTIQEGWKVWVFDFLCTVRVLHHTVRGTLNLYRTANISQHYIVFILLQAENCFTTSAF